MNELYNEMLSNSYGDYFVILAYLKKEPKRFSLHLVKPKYKLGIISNGVGKA
ncbi:hypothetical protein DFQ01_14128 [Paenibacillus cellulosilyticus]|uniref:Uncharacterized protein n=1 Tax=Paenibacillus cellulosilyticus TaxID=375489 RepID=A0A2V2YE91_9BACL|nr:hypothetical protein DFQ01_14128 [Paenibacillus cellulosilyticus]